MEIYQYNITDTANDKVYIPSLSAEINSGLTAAPAFTLACIRVGNPTSGKFQVCFDAAIDAAQQTELDAVVAAHQGFGLVTTLLAAERLIANAVTQAAWETLDGAVTSPSFFDEDLSQLFGRFTGQCKTVDAGSELQMVETKDGEPDVIMTVPPFAVPDTGGAWQQFSFGTTQAPRAGQNTYLMQGQLNAATSLELRYLSMSLLRVVIV
jgi:hypothetical protein